MPKPNKTYKQEFENGATAFVDLYQSERGKMALATQDAGNPFNGDKELEIWRSEMGTRACKELKCEPEELFYVEQVGQHWQSIPFKRGHDGQMVVPVEEQVKPVSEQSLKDEIKRIAPPELGQEHLDAPDWHKNLTHTPEGPSR